MKGTPTPNLPTNIIHTNIARLKLSGKSALDMSTPPLKIDIMLESNPLKSTMLVERLAVTLRGRRERRLGWDLHKGLAAMSQTSRQYNHRDNLLLILLLVVVVVVVWVCVVIISIISSIIIIIIMSIIIIWWGLGEAQLRPTPIWIWAKSRVNK